MVVRQLAEPAPPQAFQDRGSVAAPRRPGSRLEYADRARSARFAGFRGIAEEGIALKRTLAQLAYGAVGLGALSACGLLGMIVLIPRGIDRVLAAALAPLAEG